MGWDKVGVTEVMRSGHSKGRERWEHKLIAISPESQGKNSRDGQWPVSATTSILSCIQKLETAKLHASYPLHLRLQMYLVLLIHAPHKMCKESQEVVTLIVDSQ